MHCEQMVIGIPSLPHRQATIILTDIIPRMSEFVGMMELTEVLSPVKPLSEMRGATLEEKNLRKLPTISRFSRIRAITT